VIDASAFKTGRLCVVGNVNRDVKIAAIDPTPAIFEDGETSTTLVRETVGGGGANSALAAASLGAGVSFVGKIGADGLGARLERTLTARGVRCLLSRETNVATGTSINLVWTTGRRHFVSCLPNTTTFSFENDFDTAGLDGCDHLLRADPWFSEPMLLGAGNRKLFETARSRGVATSLDINWDPYWATASPEVVFRRKAALREVLPLIDLAHGNERELCELAGAGDLNEALMKLTGWGVGAVVVHMGKRGAGHYRDGKLIVEPAASVDRVVNTTGTGDVLSVCMMLLHARTDIVLQEKLRLSNAVVAEYIAGRRDLVPELLE
jgi:sugar/nucleoside kinase (ribokinase family)